MFKNLDNKTLVVSNDAGGANQIYYFLKKKKIRYNLYAKGPASKIFKKKNVNNLNKFILKSDFILLGSGTGAIEYEILQKSSLYNKYTIVFLENWVNFKERIVRYKSSFLPNEVWVSDQNAYLLAKKKFKNKIRVRKVKNYYLDSFTNYKKPNLKKNRVIYLSPNYDMGQITKKYRKKKDLKIFKIFLSKIDNLKKIINQNNLFIDILLHPGEKDNKYNLIKKRNSKLVKILHKIKLNQLLFKYKFAASTNSYALLVAKKIGLVTFNNIKKTRIKKTIPSKYVDYEI